MQSTKLNLKRAIECKLLLPVLYFFIDYTGEVLICSHDWGKKFIAGNINDKSILEIWKGPKFKNARKLLGNGNRKFSPCNKCDVQGVLMGTNHYSAWNNIDK